MTHDEILALFAYNRWANDRTFKAAATLGQDLLERDLKGGHASTFRTLAHIASAEWRWLARWQQKEAPGDDPLECRDLGELRSRWTAIEREQDAFIRRLGPADSDRRISYDNPPGTTWTYPLHQMLRHLVNHSTYHRGQVAMMLRQLGGMPAPTDYLVHVDELADPAVVKSLKEKDEGQEG